MQIVEQFQVFGREVSLRVCLAVGGLGSPWLVLTRAF